MSAAKSNAMRFGEVIKGMGKKSVTPEPRLAIVPDTPPQPKDLTPTRKVKGAAGHPSTETNAQIAKRIGLRPGKRVRLPDDKDGKPVRKNIGAVTNDGYVTFPGSRTRFPARDFILR